MPCSGEQSCGTAVGVSVGVGGSGVVEGKKVGVAEGIGEATGRIAVADASGALGWS